MNRPLPLGFIPDDQDERDLRMGSRSIKEHGPGDLTPFIREVFDQGHTNSCVLNAISSSVAIRAVSHGRSWNPPSRMFGYRMAVLARGTSGRDAEGKLLDEGCQPRSALKALQKLGAPSETLWPFSPEKLQEAPPWAIRRRAVDLGFQYYRCAGLTDIRLALSLGQPVVTGFSIDRAFVRADGPDVVTDFDPSELVGGHMITIVRENRDANTFTILNSWGIGWRNLGLVDLSSDLITKRSVDAWAIL